MATARKLGYANILFGVVVALLLGAIYVWLVRIAQVQSCASVAGELQQQSHALLSLVYEVRGGRETDLNSFQSSAGRFEQSLKGLNSSLASLHGPFSPLPAEAWSKADKVSGLWQQAKGPLHSDAPGVHQNNKVLQSRLVALAGASTVLEAALAEQRSVLQYRLLYTAGALSVCLLALSAFLWYKKHSTAQALDLVDKMVARVQAADLAQGDSVVTEKEWKLLKGAFNGSMGRFLTFMDAVRQHLGAIVQNVPAGLLLLSKDLRVVYANPSFLEMFGMKAEEVAGQDLDGILPGTGMSKWAQHVLLTGTPQHDVVVRQNGDQVSRTLRVTVAEIQTREQLKVRLLVVLEDLTEFKSLRTARRDYEQRYQEVLQNAGEGILVVGEDGVISDFNRAAEEMLGYSRDQVVGRPLKFLLPAVPRTLSERGLSSFFTTSHWKLDRSPLDLELLKNDGALLPVEARITRCQADAHTSMILNIRDVSERNRAELLRRDRLELIEMVAMNRPLETVLSSLAQMIERHLPGSFCAVMLRRDNRLYPAAAPSLPADYVRALTGMSIGPAGGTCGTAAFEGKLVAAVDIANDETWACYRDLALKYGLRASWSVPVYSSEGLIAGTLAVYNRERRQPESSELELLQMASRLAAVSIEQRQLTGRLAYQAQHDALTGLPNRYSFEERMRQAIAQARRADRLVGLLAVDLDRFKIINDTLGHLVGDGLLQQIGHRLSACVREADVVARWGGDEFAIGLLELRSPGDATLVAQKVLDSMNAPFEVEGHELFITATIGIGVFPADGQDLATLLKNADSALYRGKSEGKNSFQCYSPEMSETSRQRLELENQLRRALERDELMLHYQPQFELETGRLVGVEALLRWNHPKLGMVAPSRFIPIAEETGLIVPLGTWVLQESCRQIRNWALLGRPNIRVAVNVSTLQFGRSDFVDTVAHALATIGIAPRLLDLELTESQVMRNVEESAPRMEKLRELGVGISIDDFGTGYSSLSYLQRLPIDTLKIDQSFVRTVTTNSSTLPLVESIITLARSLGMKATAEGVETESQLRALRVARCHYVQGFLLGKPVPANELLAQAEGTVPTYGSQSSFIVPMLCPKAVSDNTRPGHEPLLLPNQFQPATRLGALDLTVV